MLQFTYKLKLTERVKAKCCRHPEYNPEKDGRAGIRGGCSTWAVGRARKATTATEEPPLRI